MIRTCFQVFSPAIGEARGKASRSERLPVRFQTVLVLAAATVLATPAATLAAGEFVASGGFDFAPLRTLLVTLHVIGLILGMGTAFFLDLMMIRHLYRDAIEPSTVAILEFGGRIVTAGFILLCISGAGFLALYWGVAPDKLENPKMWAKVMVVSLLLLNGMLIHEALLPRLAQQTGRPLLANRALPEAFPFLAAGVLSTVGWVFAFVLGMVREFNFIIDGQVFLAAFLILFATMLSAACLLHTHMRDGNGPQETRPIANESRIRWVLAQQRATRPLGDR